MARDGVLGSLEHWWRYWCDIQALCLMPTLWLGDLVMFARYHDSAVRAGDNRAMSR